MVKRTIVAALGCLLVILILWVGFSRVMLQQGRLEPAFPLLGARGEANARLAEYHLSQQDIDRAQAYAKKALRYSLAQPDALEALGGAEFLKENKDGGAKILRVAERWTLRGTVAQALLMQLKLEQLEMGQALDHADTLIRRQRQTDLVFSLLVTALPVGDLEQKLLQKIDSAPKWKSNFLRFLSKLPKERLEPAVPTIRKIAKLKSGIRPEDAALLTRAMVEQGYIAEAAAAWRDFSNDKSVISLRGGEQYRLDFLQAAGGQDAFETVAPFLWSLNPRQEAAVFPIDNKGMPAIEIVPGRLSGGVVMSRSFIFGGSVVEVTPQADDNAKLFGVIDFQMECANKKLPFLRERSRLQWSIKLPQECKKGKLLMVARKSIKNGGESLVLTALNLRLL